MRISCRLLVSLATLQSPTAFMIAENCRTRISTPQTSQADKGGNGVSGYILTRSSAAAALASSDCSQSMWAPVLDPATGATLFYANEFTGETLPSEPEDRTGGPSGARHAFGPAFVLTVDGRTAWQPTIGLVAAALEATHAPVNDRLLAGRRAQGHGNGRT
jgi:hypothetical protein